MNIKKVLDGYVLLDIYGKKISEKFKEIQYFCACNYVCKLKNNNYVIVEGTTGKILSSEFLEIKPINLVSAIAELPNGNHVITNQNGKILTKEYFAISAPKDLLWGYKKCINLNLEDGKYTNYEEEYLDENNHIFSLKQYKKLCKIYSNPNEFMHLGVVDFADDYFVKKCETLINQACLNAIKNSKTDSEKVYFYNLSNSLKQQIKQHKAKMLKLLDKKYYNTYKNSKFNINLINQK